MKQKKGHLLITKRINEFKTYKRAQMKTKQDKPKNKANIYYTKTHGQETKSKTETLK